MIVARLFRRVPFLIVSVLLARLPALAAGVYPHFETSFLIPNLGTDPFDYTVSDVRVLLVAPDNTTISLPAFYDGGQTWRMRHSPSLPGPYRVSGVSLNGQPLTVTGLQPDHWLVAGTPASAGFIRIDPANPTRFITSDGRRFYPLGHDLAWDVNATTNVVSILPKMGAAHENWSRIWMDPWDGKNLDWPKVGGAFGTLSLTVAQKWDAIIFAAEQAGVYFQMTLHHHGQYSSTVDPNWPQNPYNLVNGGFLSDATQFFTNATAKALTRRKLRYAVARWGYSPAVMAWELFNEVQFTDAAQKGQWTNVAAWHNEMAQFLRSQDNYHHLVTTSSQLDQPIWDQCDYYQHHDYPSDLISALRDAPSIPPGQPLKPIFGGECGMDSTPLLGFQAPLWAGLMAGQSGAAQQWYWDHVDADNAYRLFDSAQHFVRLSGIANQDLLLKSAPHVNCPVGSALVFAPGGGWASAVQTTFTVGDSAPDGIGTLPSFLQGSYHRTQMNMSNGYTLLVDYGQPGTFSVQVLQIAASGASLMITVDNSTTNRVNWPSTGVDLSTNYVLTVNVSPGPHTIRLINPGQDWLNLGNISLNPYTAILGAYQVGNSNFSALWLWHRTNIYNSTATAMVAGSVPLAGLQPGEYSGTWWDTFAGITLTNFAFNVVGTNPVNIATPSILRSTAFFAGAPPRAGVTAPSLTRILGSNSPALILPIELTNGGGLPLSYSLMVTGVSPVIYRASDSTQVGGPVYAWKDISSVGREITPAFTALTARPAADEGIAGPIDIGFAFPFFSGSQSPDSFSQLYVSPNGFVTFTPFAGDTSTNQILPGVASPANCIALFWTDLDLSSAGHVYCESDSLSGAFIVQFQDAPIRATGTTVTCQLILKTTGEILMLYRSVGNPRAFTVGLQDAGHLHGLQVAYKQPYLQNGLAVRLSPSPWFSLAANAGLVPGQGKQTIEVALDPGVVTPGTFGATLLLATADPSLPLTSLPVSLTVVTPIQKWRLDNFGTINGTGDAADDADPDQDGIVNLVEYALGLNPGSADQETLVASVVAGRLTLVYRRPHPAPPDITYIPEVTVEPVSGEWSSGPSYTTQVVSDNGDGTETVTVTDLADLSSSRAHYLRIRIDP